MFVKQLLLGQHEYLGLPQSDGKLGDNSPKPSEDLKPLEVKYKAEKKDMYTWLVKALLSPRPLQETEVPLPFRVELKDLHGVQNLIQSCCIVGVV